MTDQCMFGNRGDGLFAQETHCIAQYHKNVDKMRRHLFGTSFKSLKTRFTAIVVNQTFTVAAKLSKPYRAKTD